MEQETAKDVGTIPAILVTLAGSISFSLTPVLVGTLRREAAVYDISESQIGFLGSADPAGMFLGALLAFFAVAKYDRRFVATGALILLAFCNFGSLFLDSFETLLGLRILAGMGGGLAMAVGFAQIGASMRPDSNLSIFQAAQMVTASALIMVIAHLSSRMGVNGVFMGSLTISLAGVCACPWMRSQSPPQKSNTAFKEANAEKMLMFLTASSNFLIALGFLAFWANIQSIGEWHGIDPEMAATAVSLGLFGGGLSAIFIAFTGARFGRIRSTSVFAILMLTSATMQIFNLPIGFFLFSAFCFQAAVNCTTYVFGAISEVDLSGRLPVVYLFSIKAGFAAGPALASQVIIWNGFSGLISFTIVILTATFILYAILLKLSERQLAEGKQFQNAMKG